MENIMKIFTSQDERELKQAFKEILVTQFKDDLEKMDVYLFDPSKLEDLINDALEEVVEDIKVEFRNKMRVKMLEMMEEKFKEIKL